MQMIKKSAFTLLLAAFFSMSLMAATGPDKPDEQQLLRTELVSYLQNIDVSQSTDATLSFMVTSKNEIVVLYVDSKDSSVERTIKNRLNYKKVKTDLKQRNQKYFIDLKFETEDS